MDKQTRLMSDTDFKRGLNAAIFNLGYVDEAETMKTLVKDLNMTLEDAYLCTCAGMVVIKQLEGSDTIPPQALESE